MCVNEAFELVDELVKHRSQRVIPEDRRAEKVLALQDKTGILLNASRSSITF